MTRVAHERLLWFTLVAGLMGVVVSGVFALLQPKPEPLPVRARLPEFQFTRETGEPFRSSDLAGHTWVAGFVFTRCQGICPRLAQSMAALEEQLQDVPSFRLVAFTVDPEYDTPEVLAAYAKTHRTAPARWTFVTGNRPELWQLIGDGFLLGVAEGAETGDELIVHSPKLVLVDGRGNIRGYYDGLEPEDVEQLAKDARRLASEGS